MKPLQRYDIEPGQVIWRNDGGWTSRLEIKESNDGEWVKWEDVKKLEEQNTMMLDALNKLLHVAKIAVPIKFTNIDEVVSDCKQVINRVEGENQ